MKRRKVNKTGDLLTMWKTYGQNQRKKHTEFTTNPKTKSTIGIEVFTTEIKPYF